MPAGVLMPGMALMDPNGSVDLATAVIPTPDDNAWVILGLAEAGATAPLADPRPDAFSLIGFEGPLYDLAVFEKIHVIPREKQLGAVVSDQEFTVEVWNAFRAAARILSDITIEGSSGVQIASPPSFPDHYPATESKIYTVQISEEGDAIIDTTVTWVFVDVSPDGTDLRILGFRLIPVAFEPNMEQPIVERWGFLTDVLVAFNATEQRIQLRAVPTGSVAYSLLFNELRHAQMAGAVLYGNQARVLGVPRWQFRTVLTQAAAVDDLVVFLDTTDLPFEAGGLVFLWQSPFAWEAQTIDTVEADRLNLRLGLKTAWPAGTTVIPMVTGRLSPDEAFAWHSLTVGAQDLVFEVEGFRP